MPRPMTPPLLLTRPEPDSRRVAAMVPEFPAVISPILRIQPVPHDASRLAKAEALVFTSAHAVPLAGPGRGRLALCVGGHTSQRAAAAGFRVVTGGGTAESLLPLILQADRPLLHPHGRHLARRLPVQGIVVYDQVEQPLSPAARLLLAQPGPVVVPVFSPRSARLLSRQVAAAAAPLWVAAISPAALAAWHGPVVRRQIADTPSLAGMVAAIRRLANREPC